MKNLSPLYVCVKAHTKITSYCVTCEFTDTFCVEICGTFKVHDSKKGLRCQVPRDVVILPFTG